MTSGRHPLSGRRDSNRSGGPSATPTLARLFPIQAKNKTKTLFLSGRRDSNPRPQPWQGCALPAELLSLFSFILKRIANLNEAQLFTRILSKMMRCFPKYFPFSIYKFADICILNHYYQPNENFD